jgi:NADH-quinone oxidoreductase subunit E
MSVRRLAPESVQPSSFAFSAANENWITQQISKFPEGRQASAVIPLLWRAQEQEGWISQKAIEAIGHKLSMPYIRVLEVATFYSMFNLQPVGKHFIQLCGTTPCALRGAEAIKQVCRSRIGNEMTVTADGNFSWLEVECLGACCNAPMVQINNDYYEDLTPESFGKLLDGLASGKAVKTGPQTSRTNSEPEGGAKTLLDKSLFDGSVVGGWKKDFDSRAKKYSEAKALAAATAAAAAGNAAGASAAPAVSATPAVVAKPVNGASTTAKAAAANAKAPVAAFVTPPMGKAPGALASARGGKADDLTLIWGVGPKLGKMLNGMGIFHFDQIAGWGKQELGWVDENLEGFKGRASRDEWVKQAKKLATGWRPDSKLGDRPVK